MSALTADRLIVERSGDRRVFPVKAGVKIFAGAQVAVDANGLAAPFTTATGLKGAGRADSPADNTGGANGAITVTVRVGIFRYDNSTSTDALTQADITADCYGVDDQTVAKTSATSTRSIAGKVFDVDADGVWVKYS